MRAVMSTACYPAGAPNLDTMVLAQVRYTGSKSGDPNTQGLQDDTTGGCVDLDPNSLTPVKEVNPPPKADQSIVLTFEFKADAQNVNRAFVNDVSYQVSPYRPVLLEAIVGRTDQFMPEQNIYAINKTQWVDIVVNNHDNGEHPFHLHGHSFMILGSGDGDYDAAKHGHSLKLNNPLRRDVSTVPASGWAVIRFFADNPGAWLFHCHIEWHVLAGLVTTILELPDELQKKKIPENAAHICNGQIFPQLIKPLHHTLQG